MEQGGPWHDAELAFSAVDGQCDGNSVRDRQIFRVNGSRSRHLHSPHIEEIQAYNAQLGRMVQPAPDVGRHTPSLKLMARSCPKISTLCLARRGGAAIGQLPGCSVRTSDDARQQFNDLSGHRDQRGKSSLDPSRCASWRTQTRRACQCLDNSEAYPELTSQGEYRAQDKGVSP